MKETMTTTVNKQNYTDTKSTPSVISDTNIYCDLGVTMNNNGISHKFNMSVSIPCNFEDIDNIYKIARIYVGNSLMAKISKLCFDKDIKVNPIDIQANYNNRIDKSEIGFSQGLSMPIGNWEFVKINIGINHWCDLKDIDSKKLDITKKIQDLIDKETIFMKKIHKEIRTSEYLMFVMPKKDSQTKEKIKEEKATLLGGDYVFTFGKYSEFKLGFKQAIREIPLDELHSYYSYLKKSDNTSSSGDNAIANIEMYFSTSEIKKEIDEIVDDVDYWTEKQNLKKTNKAMEEMGEPPF